MKPNRPFDADLPFDIVADWRCYGKDLACRDDVLNLLVTTDPQYPVWLVLYDRFREQHRSACGDEGRLPAPRDWLNSIVRLRFTLEEWQGMLVWVYASAGADQLYPIAERWPWSLSALRDAESVAAVVRVRAARLLEQWDAWQTERKPRSAGTP